MKIKIYLLGFIFVIFGFGKNQLFSQDFQGGVFAGINGSQVAGDHGGGYNKAGIFGGGFVKYGFTDKWAAQMEIEYSQKGSRFNPTEENNYYQYLLRVDYIDIPLLVQFHASKKIVFELGASYSYLLHNYEEVYFSQDVVNRGFNQSSANLVAGMYYYFTENIFVNLRTSNGLTPLRNDPTKGYTARLGKAGQYNDLLSLSLWYNFGSLGR